MALLYKLALLEIGPRLAIKRRGSPGCLDFPLASMRGGA